MGGIVNIEIISACNNTCDFCYQKNEHNTGDILTFDEIKEITDWITPNSHIEISGGEPTMHPDFIEIVKYCASKHRIILYTNLLCNKNIINELLEINYLVWSININAREELKHLFFENLELINCNSDKIISNKQTIVFVLPLVGEIEKDKIQIDNLDKIIEQYKNFKKEIEIHPCMITEGKILPIDFSKSINCLLDITEKKYNNIPILSKCQIDFCEYNIDTITRILKNKNCSMPGTCYRRKIHIDTKKRAKYCHLCKNGFLTVGSYKDFTNSTESLNWFRDRVTNYMKYNENVCLKKKPDCHNNLCAGICPVVNEAMRIQNNIPTDRLF